MDPELKFWVFLLFTAILLNGTGVYLRYRREYCNYLGISRYLDQFEQGNYECHMKTITPEAGINSQIADQMERLGAAFGTLMTRITREKENTRSLVTDISHQLKTPVSALSMSFELMEDAKITEKERREFQERGRGQVDKLKHLMDALVNLSRLEADMIRLKSRGSSLKNTLVAAVNGVYYKANAKNIQFEMEEFQDVIVEHDGKWTAEAISNVLDNAVKYSPENSKVQIRIEPQISYVLIKIQDEGIGIPREEYQNIFKRFYRGSALEVERCEGAGVGLYLARQILEEEGGSISAVSGRGRGTIFQITLPTQKYLH